MVLREECLCREQRNRARKDGGIGLGSLQCQAVKFGLCDTGDREPFKIAQ